MYYYYYHEQKKYKLPKGFYLNKLILKDHKVFGNEIEIDFMDIKDSINQDFEKNLYTSLIIGPNGTGKSLLFAEIITIFLSLRDGIDKSNSKFYLSYFFNEKKYEFFNYDYTSVNSESKKIRRSKLACKINDIDADYNIDQLPKSLLASSLLLNDRYTISKSENNFYKYLGIRNINSPRTAGTRNNIKRNVDQIISNFENGDNSLDTKIKFLLDFLGYDEEFRIKYKPKYRPFFFNGLLTEEKFVELFENYNHETKGFSKRKDSEFIPFGVAYYKKHLAGNKYQISKIVKFLNDLQDSPFYIRQDYERSRSLNINVLLGEISKEIFTSIKILQELDLLSFPSVYLIKDREPIEISEISSGEYNILSGLISIYTNIEDNSLIFIDEPEISLHPNWQMRYVTFLRDLFKEYPSCHFIIATHSHFFASDLDGRYSKIIGLRRDIKDKINVVNLLKDINTFGWSAEQILLEIFNVSTTRNYYIYEKISDIMELIAKKDRDNLLIGEKVDELLTKKVFELSKVDPLNTIWTKIVDKYATKKS